MCTVTWAMSDDGFDLLCNRDEARSREVAFSPGVHTQRGVRYVSPVDGRHGGTWIAANEFGLALCLTNGVRGGHGAKRPGSTSRGLLVTEWIDAAGMSDVVQRASATELAEFAPFTMAILDPGIGSAVLEWDGEHKVFHPSGEWFLPLSSSSCEPDAALESRQRLFARMGPASAAELYRFHESHEPHAGARSCCMHRADAETVSFSWLRVGGDRVDLFYVPGAPCQWKQGQHATLLRVSQ